MSFIEPQLAELLLQSLRDLVTDAIPRAAVIGIALVIGTAGFLRARQTFRRGRRPRRPLPAAV